MRKKTAGGDAQYDVWDGRTLGRCQLCARCVAAAQRALPLGRGLLCTQGWRGCDRVWSLRPPSRLKAPPSWPSFGEWTEPQGGRERGPLLTPSLGIWGFVTVRVQGEPARPFPTSTLGPSVSALPALGEGCVSLGTAWAGPGRGAGPGRALPEMPEVLPVGAWPEPRRPASPLFRVLLCFRSSPFGLIYFIGKRFALMLPAHRPRPLPCSPDLLRADRAQLSWAAAPGGGAGVAGPVSGLWRPGPWLLTARTQVHRFH